MNNSANSIQYFFTKFGDIYAGFDFSDSGYSDNVIVVQPNKVKEFNNLNFGADKSKVATIFPRRNLVKILEEIDIPYVSKERENLSFSSQISRKDLFIIGAGASAFCVPKDENNEFYNDYLRPPLGNQLFSRRFENIYKNYEGVKLSLFDLQNKDINVEEYFENEWQHIQNHANPNLIQRHINIQFYLQELLYESTIRVVNQYFGINLYSKMANILQKKYHTNPNQQFSFVSFNQDTIFENFLFKHFVTELSHINDYVRHNESPFCIFKPHGSWNWGWKFPQSNGKAADWVYKKKLDFYQLYYEELGDLSEMVNWKNWGNEALSNENGIGRYSINKDNLQLVDISQFSNFYPAILLPYRDKDEFTMPQLHYDIMRYSFGTIENIYIIGWKGNEALFNKLLISNVNKLKKLVIVDPDKDGVVKNLGKLIEKQKPIIKHYKTFEEFILFGLDIEINENIN